MATEQNSETLAISRKVGGAVASTFRASVVVMKPAEAWDAWLGTHGLHLRDDTTPELVNAQARRLKASTKPLSRLGWAAATFGVGLGWVIASAVSSIASAVFSMGSMIVTVVPAAVVLAVATPVWVAEAVHQGYRGGRYVLHGSPQAAATPAPEAGAAEVTPAAETPAPEPVGPQTSAPDVARPAAPQPRLAVASQRGPARSIEL